MICLDTNFLIRALVPGTSEGDRIMRWLEQGEPIALPAVAWYEFLCGPVEEEELALATALLTAGVLPFTDAQAAEAARLYNAVNRARRFRVDAMVAATAITHHATLATLNRADFAPFSPHGLKLA